MTRNGALEAFMRGDIDRRDLMAKLATLGVSAGAATAYAATIGIGSAAAAPQPVGSGIARFQEGADEENYGTAIELESDAEGAGYLLTDIAAILSILTSIDSFSPGDFDEGVYDLLVTIRDQQSEHADALASLFDPPLTLPDGVGETFPTPEELLAALSAALDDLVATYAAVIPAIEGDEASQTMTEVALVAASHAAIVRFLAGEEPFPGSFQTPSDPTGE